MKLFRLSVTVIMMILLSQSFLAAKTKNTDESRFQLGFGTVISTSNLLGLIENVRLYQAMENGETYDYPGLSDEEKAAVNKLAKNMGRAILIANILGGFEYGIQTRLLWSALMIEADLFVLPFDASYNGRVDMMLTTNIGIRAPFFIMPYITAGANFTFSWYPENVANVDSWKSWGVFNNFVFRPGMNVRAGLDLKFKHFSLGAYYQYTIKDFEEFTGWWSQLSQNLYNDGIDKAGEQAAGLIFAAQSRFGISVAWYFF